MKNSDSILAEALQLYPGDIQKTLAHYQVRIMAQVLKRPVKLLALQLALLALMALCI